MPFNVWAIITAIITHTQSCTYCKYFISIFKCGCFTLNSHTYSIQNPTLHYDSACVLWVSVCPGFLIFCFPHHHHHHQEQQCQTTTPMSLLLRHPNNQATKLQQALLLVLIVRSVGSSVDSIVRSGKSIFSLFSFRARIEWAQHFSANA